jgi:ribose transport system substrate-binding protein
MMRLLLTVVSVLTLALAGGCGDSSSRSPSRVRIAVVPKGTTHAFWNSVEAGARRAEKELGIEIVWKGPQKENDRAQQISIVESFITEGISGIVLAPLDDAALVAPVRQAASRKIPVVIFDSALRGEAGRDFVSFVATDNRKGGHMGGQELARLLNGKGKIVLLRYAEGSASTMEREAGFLEAIAEHPGLTLIESSRYAGPTIAEAQTVAMNMLDRLKEADGIFCPNESSTFGMLLALRQNGLAGRVKFVGFDTSSNLIDGLRKGEIHALVAQNPTRMGYEGVKLLVAHIRGERVPQRVDTGVELVTAENLDTEPIKALLGGQ